MRFRSRIDIVMFVVSTLVGGCVVALTMYSTSVSVLGHPIELIQAPGAEAIWMVLKILGPPIFLLLCAIVILALSAYARAMGAKARTSHADREAYGG